MRILKFLLIPLQISVLCIFYSLVQQIVAWFHIPIPASVLGMVLLAILLITDIIPLHFIEDGSQCLIKLMPIMFVPDGVALFYSGDILKNNGVMLLLMFLISTIMVMSLTAITSIYMQKDRKQLNNNPKVEG
ncbi:CidA/LrgA family protein [Bacillus sp. JJ1562]|uniref:CidA/LrgA family protein n=1 Tax=Bacillus sp. JJ1562 TaxID=3122960 RepID=UPI003002609C